MWLLWIVFAQFVEGAKAQQSPYFEVKNTLYCRPTELLGIVYYKRQQTNILSVAIPACTEQENEIIIRTPLPEGIKVDRISFMLLSQGDNSHTTLLARKEFYPTFHLLKTFSVTFANPQDITVYNVVKNLPPLSIQD